MDRRSFIRLTAIGGSAGWIVPSAVLAELPQPPAAGGLYYTKDAPGRWSSKVQTHLPLIEKEKTDGGLGIRVITPHEMKGCEHYIVKHVLLDSRFQFLQEHLFDPQKDKSPISSFDLKGDQKGPLYALSMCNLHDVWLNMLEV
jgi:superoxide reductase